MYIDNIKLAAYLLLKPALEIDLIILIVKFDILFYFLYHMRNEKRIGFIYIFFSFPY